MLKRLRSAIRPAGLVAWSIVCAVGGYWIKSGTLDPLASRTAHSLTRDRMQVVLEVDPQDVREGEDVRVMPRVTGAVLTSPGGTLEISCGENGILEPRGNMRLSIASAQGPALLPEVLCRAVRPGTATISARADLGMPVDVTAVAIGVSEGTRTGKPKSGNLSGQWDLSLDTTVGQMWISHHWGRVDGEYRTDTKRGSVWGTADGGKVMVTLGEFRFATRYAVDGDLHESNGMIEIIGTAEKRIPGTNGEWQRSADKPVRFHAVAGGPGRASSGGSSSTAP
jgi:hypothetical protein